MTNRTEWIESKAKERMSQNFVRTVLELSGYRVMAFGIENHNQEIIKEIKSNYRWETNRRLLSMPDFVIVDEDSKKSWITEVKHRTFKENLDIRNLTVRFKQGQMRDYLAFWREATLILTFNVKPYCLCIDLNKVDWSIHLKEKITGRDNRTEEVWKFTGICE
ncbi:hypothetical protein D6764_02240, partial [Candidatus Woesearchaeota archaeon]